ncbi:MAG: hypothetical protein OXJ64_01370 [Boseongicola sp.]|nr:hypothetical protein [Boseongicola sp.]
MSRGSGLEQLCSLRSQRLSAAFRLSGALSVFTQEDGALITQFDGHSPATLAIEAIHGRSVIRTKPGTELGVHH